MVLLSLILIVIISGCGGQQTIQTGKVNDGIIIKDFSFDQSEVYAGDYVKLNLEVQNMGEKEGILTRATIYGGWLTGEGVITDKKDILDPAIPSENFEGGAKYFKWTNNAPLGIQASTNYQFGVRVKYDYQTEYIGTVRFVNPTYLDSLSKQQKDSLIVSNGIISSTVSNGPLNINPISGRSFIVGSLTSVPIKFGIKNVGSGYPYIVEGDYSVKIISQTGVSCTTDNIKLSRGETGTFICDFSVPSGFGNYVDKTFKIIFNYSYYVDSMTSITVNPSGVPTTTTASTTTTAVYEIFFNSQTNDHCNDLCNIKFGGTCESIGWNADGTSNDYLDWIDGGCKELHGDCSTRMYNRGGTVLCYGYNAAWTRCRCKLP